MSLLKSNSVQIGQSATATNNFTLSVPSSPDGTIKLARGNSGATTADIFSVTSAGAISGATLNGGGITLGTTVNTTSGTAVDFTGIPSWVKRITVMFNGVTKSGSSNYQIQIGPSAGVETSGYLSRSTYASSGVATGNSGTSFCFEVQLQTNAINGSMIISLLNASTNTWVEQGIVGSEGGGWSSNSSGAKSLAGVLANVKITAGGNTFSAGSVNIMYEG